MSTEFPLSYLVSNLAKSLQELAKKSAAKNRLLRLNNFVDKFQQTSKQLRTSLSYRAAVRICAECSGTIRPWDSRVLVSQRIYLYPSKMPGKSTILRRVRALAFPTRSRRNRPSSDA